MVIPICVNHANHTLERNLSVEIELTPGSAGTYVYCSIKYSDMYTVE